MRNQYSFLDALLPGSLIVGFMIIIASPVACTHPNPASIPVAKGPTLAGNRLRIVHNSCSNVWAISTGKVKVIEIARVIRAFAIPEQETFIGIGRRRDPELDGPELDGPELDGYHVYDKDGTDTVMYAPPGHEITFDDSLSAIACLRRYEQSEAIAAYVDSIKVAVIAQEKAYNDSIFRCKHTYK